MTGAEAEHAQRAASGSSFYWGMRVLPRDKREGMYAIYRFCRAVDDIADDTTALDAGARAAELRLWGDAIAALFAGVPSDKAAFLESPVKSFGLRERDFLSVIEGMQMDASGTMVAPDLAMLDHYCDCVASAVGRLSIKVFGMDETPGFALAHHLGRALQLTNILRDLDEDAELGRLYLPLEFLEAASIRIASPSEMIADPAIDPVCCGVAHLAGRHYAEADKVIRSQPRGDLRPPRLMQAVYAATLVRMQKRGWAPPRERVRVSKGILIALVLRYVFAT
jgi:squalene synthase HpnD